jgi:predicted RNA-binding Zn ribbon-like protein
VLGRLSVAAGRQLLVEARGLRRGARRCRRVTDTHIASRLSELHDHRADVPSLDDLLKRLRSLGDSADPDVRQRDASGAEPVAEPLAASATTCRPLTSAERPQRAQGRHRSFPESLK